MRLVKKGFEYEKKFLLATDNEIYLPNPLVLLENTIKKYDQILREGTKIKQGYFFDKTQIKRVFKDLGLSLNWKYDTVRIREYGINYFLTVKSEDSKEYEWRITRTQFNVLWPETKGHRIYKKRLEQKFEGWTVEYDAFIDRFLLMAEVEVENEADLSRVPILGLDVSDDKKWSNKKLCK